jgi:hypothetical protein
MIGVGAFVGRHLRRVEAIEHDGEILIVVQWSADTARGTRKPALVVPLRRFQYQKDHNPQMDTDYFLNDPLPESLFLAILAPDAHREFGVMPGPDVEFPMPDMPTKH